MSRASSELIQLRIALISFEYAGVIQGGGLGTYMRNLAAMLAGRGHTVEIFTALDACTEAHTPGITVHEIPAGRHDFAMRVGDMFVARHRAMPFDVIEASEYGADIKEIAKCAPDVPRVVKLGTATFIIDAINAEYTPWWAKARFTLGGLRRGRLPRPYWRVVHDDDDEERAVTLSADEVTSCSRSLLDMTARSWPIDLGAARVIPYVYAPAPGLLAIAPDTRTHRIVFVGRLEVRKGVIELARAVRRVLAEVPQARFRFVGRSVPRPGSGEDLQTLLERILGADAECVEFTGGVPYERIPALLADADVAIFPSYWEAFGYVCLEAMAAARGVIGSSAGGMAEIIEDGRTGLLVPPRNPKAVAGAIVALLRNPELRIAMGRAARDHVVTAYSADAIGPLQEASYARAIARAKARLAPRAALVGA